VTKECEAVDITSKGFACYSTFFELPEFERTAGADDFSCWWELIGNDFDRWVSFGMMEVYPMVGKNNSSGNTKGNKGNIGVYEQ